MSTSVQPESDQLAAVRAWARGLTSQGHKTADIEAALKQKYPGLTLAKVMAPNGADFGRSVLQGLTYNHGAQVSGAAHALFGGDYAQNRDQFAQNQTESMAANPIANTAVQMVAGGLPAMAASMIPGMAPVEGATMMNTLRGAIQGGGTAAALAHGNNQPIASLPVAASAVLGGVGGAVASKLASRSLPGGDTKAVAGAAATQLPRDPVALQASMARQEALAPNTVVLADANPEMRAMVKLVGADAKTAVEAKDAALQRYRVLASARRGVGVNYNELDGQMASVDPDLLTALAATGKKGVIAKGQTDIDLGKLHDIRTNLLAEARATRNSAVKYTKEAAAQKVTDWMVKQAPFVEQLDSDYAFLTDRLTAARQTLKDVTNSSKNYAVAKAGGIEPGSAGASLPTTVRQVPGVVYQVVNKLGAPDRAARAKAVASLLLSPSRTQDGLQQLVLMHGILMNPPGSQMLQAGTAITSGNVLPRAATSLLTPQQ